MSLLFSCSNFDVSDQIHRLNLCHYYHSSLMHFSDNSLIYTLKLVQKIKSSKHLPSKSPELFSRNFLASLLFPSCIVKIVCFFDLLRVFSENEPSFFLPKLCPSSSTSDVFQRTLNLRCMLSSLIPYFLPICIKLSVKIGDCFCCYCFFFHKKLLFLASACITSCSFILFSLLGSNFGSSISLKNLSPRVSLKKSKSLSLELFSVRF